MRRSCFLSEGFSETATFFAFIFFYIFFLINPLNFSGVLPFLPFYLYLSLKQKEKKIKNKDYDDIRR